MENVIKIESYSIQDILNSSYSGFLIISINIDMIIKKSFAGKDFDEVKNSMDNYIEKLKTGEI